MAPFQTARRTLPIAVLMAASFYAGWRYEDEAGSSHDRGQSADESAAAHSAYQATVDELTSKLRIAEAKLAGLAVARPCPPPPPPPPLPAAAAPLPGIETPSPACAASIMDGIELRGTEYAHSTAVDPADCCQRCAQDGREKCTGFTFNQDEKLCRFKTDIHAGNDGWAKCHVCKSFRYSIPEDLARELMKAAHPPQVAGEASCTGDVVDVGFARQVFNDALGGRVAAPPGDAPADVVIVTGWRRPVFLLEALTRLLMAELAEQHRYLVVLEPGYEPMQERILEAFPLPLEVFKASRHKLGHGCKAHGDRGHACRSVRGGNSFTTLEGYRYAEMLGDDSQASRVYLVEEDVFVARDFFRFHRAGAGGCPQDDSEEASF
eukprot:SAG22_NODE_1345_length_4675_cov_2.245629_1_plen_378_part_00